MKKDEIYRKISSSYIYILLSDIADMINAYWVAKCILQALPIVWTAIYQIMKSRFVDDNGNMNRLGIIISAGSCIASLFIIIITNYKSYRDFMRQSILEDDKEQIESQAVVYQSINSASISTKADFVRILQENGNKLKTLQNERTISSFLKDAYDPLRRIDVILNEICSCLESISSIQKDKIYISAAVNLSKGTWEWISNPPIAGTPSLGDLISKKSAFHRVAVENRPYVYGDDKEAEAKEGRYLLDGKDATCGNQGSFICWEVSQHVSKSRLRMIVSISTYGIRISSGGQPLSEDKIVELYEKVIKEMLLESFEHELSEAMIIYGMMSQRIK